MKIIFESIVAFSKNLQWNKQANVNAGNLVGRWKYVSSRKDDDNMKGIFGNSRYLIKCMVELLSTNFIHS